MSILKSVKNLEMGDYITVGDEYTVYIVMEGGKGLVEVMGGFSNGEHLTLDEFKNEYCLHDDSNVNVFPDMESFFN